MLLTAETPELGPNLISIQPQLPALIREQLDQIDTELRRPIRVLDIGAGNGRFLKLAGERFPGFHVVCLEKEAEFCSDLRNSFADAVIVQADAVHLPFSRGLDLAIAINVTHEVCEGSSSEERLANFKNFSRSVSSVLNPGGELLFWDGAMPENSDRIIHMEAKTDEACVMLERFKDGYRGEKITIEHVNKMSYQLSLADLATFITKILFIDTPYWDTERRQYYPFLYAHQMASSLKEAGLEPTAIKFPQGGPAREVLYSLYEMDIKTFPPTQVMIRARKQ